MSRRLLLMTITVSPAGKSGGNGPLRRSIGLPSPVPRHLLGASMTQTSPVTTLMPSSGGRYFSVSRDDAATDMSTEFVHYTVHILPTPECTAAAATVDAELPLPPEKSYISGAIFTGGLTCATRGHVINCSSDGTNASVATAIRV